MDARQYPNRRGVEPPPPVLYPQQQEHGRPSSVPRAPDTLSSLQSTHSYFSPQSSSTTTSTNTTTNSSTSSASTAMAVDPPPPYAVVLARGVVTTPAISSTMSLVGNPSQSAVPPFLLPSYQQQQYASVSYHGSQPQTQSQRGRYESGDLEETNASGHGYNYISYARSVGDTIGAPPLPPPPMQQQQQQQLESLIMGGKREEGSSRQQFRCVLCICFSVQSDFQAYFSVYRRIYTHSKK